jgi:plasmid maintenance system antidote protein VapI
MCPAMRNQAPNEVLAAWLAENGVRPAALARQASLSAPFLTRLLQGKKGLSPASADRLAKITGIDVRLLLGVSIPKEAA